MRAQYIGWDPTLKGRLGNCGPASGHDDPESCEEGAYFFQADGDTDAAYVDPTTDLSFTFRPTEAGEGFSGGGDEG